MQNNATDLHCSFIVALYNRADLIERCLDTLVYQRTSRRFEIIVVDDQSTDNSLEIARLWEARHPDVVRVVQNPDKGVANAKNLGVKSARGRFVAFVDSDDYVDYRYLETMIGDDGALSADMIIAPIWSVCNGVAKRLEVVSGARGAALRRNCLASAYFFLHGKLFRRELFDDFGYLPKLRISEDTSWVFPAIARVNSLICIDKPGYFYELSNNSISSSFNSDELIQNAVTSSQIILDQTPARFRAEAEAYVMRRLLWYYVPKFKGSAHVFRAFLLAHPDLCIRWTAEVAKTSPESCDRLKALMEGEPALLPTTVFVNGFNGEPDATLYSSAFGDQTSVEILTSRNCALAEAPACVRAAAAKGDAQFVGAYFGLRRVFEKGGVYLDASMQVLHPFGQLRETAAFFAYATEHAFSDKVFGGLARQEAFRLLLATYESNDIDAQMPLADRIRVVATGLTNLPSTAMPEAQSGMGVTMCPVSWFVYSEGAERNGAMTIDTACPPESVRAFDRARLQREFGGGVAAASTGATASVKALVDEVEYYRRQIAAMETSVVWRLKERLKRPLSRFGVFAPLKRFGNTMLRVVKS